MDSHPWIAAPLTPPQFVFVGRAARRARGSFLDSGARGTPSKCTPFDFPGHRAEERHGWGQTAGVVPQKRREKRRCGGMFHRRGRLFFWSFLRCGLTPQSPRDCVVFFDATGWWLDQDAPLLEGSGFGLVVRASVNRDLRFQLLEKG